MAIYRELIQFTAKAGERLAINQAAHRVVQAISVSLLTLAYSGIQIYGEHCELVHRREGCQVECDLAG